MARLRHSRRCAVVALAAAVALGGGCGVQFADLFLVTRTGSGPGAKLTMLVNDGGTVRCNGGAPRDLPSDLLLVARPLARDIAKPAQQGLRLAPRPGSILQYTVKSQDGTLAFADNSRPLPPALSKMQLFTRQVATTVCGLPR